MDYVKIMFLESIKLDLQYLEMDSMNYYPPPKIKKIIGSEAFESYLKDLKDMKSQMPRFRDEDELQGEARDVWRMIKECYRKMERYQKRKKENREVERSLHKAEEMAKELYECLEDKDKRFFSEDEDIRDRYSEGRVDYELPVAFDVGHGKWDIRQVKNCCQRTSIESKIDELERQIAGPPDHSQMQGGLDLVRSRMKELGMVIR